MRKPLALFVCFHVNISTFPCIRWLRHLCLYGRIFAYVSFCESFIDKGCVMVYNALMSTENTQHQHHLHTMKIGSYMNKICIDNSGNRKWFVWRKSKAHRKIDSLIVFKCFLIDQMTSKSAKMFVHLTLFTCRSQTRHLLQVCLQ